MILNYLKYTTYIIPKKQWYKPIFFTFIILIFFIYPVNAVNLITNGDFETGDLTGWTAYYGSFTIYTDDTRDGIYSAGFTSTGSAKAMYQSIDLSDVDTLYLYTKIISSTNPSLQGIYVEIDLGTWDYRYSGVHNWTLREIDVSTISGVHNIGIYFHTDGYGGTLSARVDCVSTDHSLGGPPLVAEGDLYIGGLDNSFCSSNQNWYVNDTKYSGIDVYFNELVDYKIDNFDTSKEYFINCSTSNESWDYDYFKILINDRGGNSFDNTGIQRVSSMTNILYPDEPTTYTFGLYELSEPISEHFPWYYWLLYPLYMLIDWFAEDEGMTVTEIDTIEIRLSRVSGDNETEPDFPEPPEQPDIPDPETEVEEPINWTVPEEPPTYEGANQTVNLTWVEGYYTKVNNTIEGLYSPIYNFTGWTLTPITSLTSSITDFNTEMNKSFLQSKIDSEGLYSSFNTIITAIHPKIINVISYYLIWLILLLILRKR